jgi:hypothetical protein
MKRPTFLTIWLSLMTIGNVYTLYQYTLGAAAIKQTLTTMPSWALTALALFSLLMVIAVAMLWMWKKMGFYLVIAAALLVASVNGAILGILGLAGSLSALIGIGILYLAMKPVWQNFK